MLSCLMESIANDVGDILGRTHDHVLHARLEIERECVYVCERERKRELCSIHALQNTAQCCYIFLGSFHYNNSLRPSSYIRSRAGTPWGKAGIEGSFMFGVSGRSKVRGWIPSAGTRK